MRLLNDVRRMAIFEIWYNKMFELTRSGPIPRVHKVFSDLFSLR